ncbi:MAG: imidazolonepropionase [Planctomycetota bacterium]|nr:imidazolonepropionase [Planctomycetota bacterium]
MATTPGTLYTNARVLTLAGPRPRRGAEMANLGVIERGSVLVRGGVIERVEATPTSGGALSASIASGPAASIPGVEIVDLAGRVLMPALVDCHTHACFAGSRVDEWGRVLRGESYLDVLRSGGGIMSTVRAVRAASQEKLADNLRSRLQVAASAGTGAIEVKSGYGLSTRDELKMLRAIADAASHAGCSVDVRATALLGHALDPDVPREDFVRATIEETLPAVHVEFPGVAIDAYCERGAWNADECSRLFESARALGHPIRMHADQFNSLGMVERAIALGARSVDHLEASSPETLVALAASTAVGVILPLCGLHMGSRSGNAAQGTRFADARPLIDAGGALAIATNFNPGSAPGLSLPLAMAIAVRECGVTPAEAIAAATVNAAHVLRLDDRGSIEPGQRADLLALDTDDERELAYWLASPPISRRSIAAV